MLNKSKIDFIVFSIWAYGSPCEGVGNWCPTTVPQAGGSGGRKCGIQYCINWRVFSRRTGSPQAGSYVRKKGVKNVHFRAQIGQKCTLFASESAKKGVFCRGEGRLFGRPKTGVFGVRGVASSRARESRFRSRFSETKTPFVLPRHKNRTMHLRIAPPRMIK